jgi:glycosyltransferase involved in cell wall biosynthesis
MPERSGPGICRNRGVAAARADLVLFIDDDVRVRPDTAAALVASLEADPTLTAVVGMVEARTPVDTPSSRYFNLRKHYDYKVLEGPMTNLYTSVTAIRKQAFLESGGFDESVTAIAIEDAELGRRLVRMGHRIALNRDARVVHLKHHTFESLMRNDHKRAAHFMRLLLRERLAADLVTHKRFASFRMGAIVTAAVGPATLALLPLAPVVPGVWPVAALGTGALLAANRGFLAYAKAVFGAKAVLPMAGILMADAVAVSSGLLRGGIGYALGRVR